MNKVVLVTGASSGIGKATALRLIKEGHTVYGAARRVEMMSDIVKAGGKAIKLDITNHDQVKEEVDKIISIEKRVDILVNNAGYAVYGPVEEVSYEQAKRQFEVNLFGLAEVTKAVLPSMRSQRSGKIINVSSVGGKVYTPLGSWYHASKHALEGWSDSLRLELKQFGVDVVIIQPGVIGTEFGNAMDHQFGNIEDSNYGELKETMANMLSSTVEPGKFSEPIVIANTILKAIKSKRPKTRYVAGKQAKASIISRKLLSDRGFDKLFMSMIKNYSK